MKIKFDEYELRARVFPAIIVTLPAIAAIYIFFSGARTLLGIASGTIIESAFLFFLAKIARDRGKRIQEDLYTKWGGKTTTTMLRHHDNRLDQFTKERYKQTLISLTGIPFPNIEQEASNPARADQLYESAIKALIEKRRSKTYRLVFTENCNFGFVRNLRGLKTIGLTVSFLSLCSFGVLYWKKMGNIPDSWYIPPLVGIMITLLLLFITDGAVRRTSEAYAEALLRTCEPTIRGQKSKS